MVLLVRWLLFALAIIFTAWLVPGIEVQSFQSAMLVTVIGFLAAFLGSVVLAFLGLIINMTTINGEE